jgi:adenosylcobinamide-GDP ribazoletransferase
MMIKSLITAMRTLTAIPFPGKGSDKPESSLPWFPIVGALAGAICFGAGYGICIAAGSVWPQAAGLAALICSIVITRGLHKDGLADWADSFGAINDREKALAIMKDSHIGVFGVCAVAIIILAQWIAYAQLFKVDRAICIIAAFAISRTMQVELATSFAYARKEGGTAEAYVSSAKWYHRLIALIFGFALSMVLCGYGGAIAFIIAWIITMLFGLHSKKRLGGVTGDILGAGNELIETAMLFFFCLYPQNIQPLHLMLKSILQQ